MSGGGSGGGGTTRMEPPSYLVPHLERAAGASGGLYGEGGPQQYPGQTVVPFADQTQQALGMAETRAGAGSPNVRAAQDLNLRTLQGDFLSGNPELDAQISRGLQLSRNNMDTQFAGAGRNIEAQLPARSEQVNNFVSDMLYKNYDAERGRQTQAMGMASPLANQDYFDISQMANVGGAVENKAGEHINDASRRWGFEQDRPEANMDRYISRLMGQSGGYGSQDIDTDQNRLLSAGGGALAGGMGGSALANALGLAGPWGWAGAGLGGLIGLLG